jgi:hypothetical protein
MADQIAWQLSGDCFENCNCSAVCPCLVPAAAPLTAVGARGNTFHDHDMLWDSSGKNGLYAPIRWSNLS